LADGPDSPLDEALAERVSDRYVPAWIGRLERTADAHADVIARMPLIGLNPQPGYMKPPGRSGGGGGEGDLPRTGGQPLDPGVRAALEVHFGRDLSRVRVHTDPATGRAVDARSAKAVQQGEHVYFGTGQYAPTSPGGRRLIGHEVAHIEQFYDGLVGPREELADDVTTRTRGGRQPPCRLRIVMEPDSDPALEGQEVRFRVVHDPIMKAAGSRYPRISKSWKVVAPDGDEDTDWYVFSSPPWYKDVTFEQTGLYRVYAWVEWRRGEVYRLELTKRVTTPEVIAADQFGGIEGHDYLQFRVGVAAQHIEIVKGGVDQQRFGDVYITSPTPNPAGANTQYDGYYTVHGCPEAKSFRWYARLADWEGMPTQNYYGYRSTTIHGERAMSLPSGERSTRWRLGKGTSHTIVCECLDERGETIATARYLQVVMYSEEYERVQAYERYMAQVDEAMAGIAEGGEVGVRALYVNNETGTAMQLPLFVGRRGRDVVLVDLTPGVERREYEGSTVADAVSAFARGNAYPTGLIDLEVPSNSAGIAPTTRRIETDGKSLWQSFSSAFSWASLGLVAGGIVLSFVPGGQAAALVCFVSAGATGAVAGGFSIYDELQKAEVSSTRVTIDVLGIAGSMLGGAGAVMFRGLAAGNAVRVAGMSGRFVLWTGFTADGVGGLLLTVDGVQQIQAILEDDRLGRGDKINTVVAILSGLALNGGLLLLGYRDARQTTAALRQAQTTAVPGGAGGPSSSGAPAPAPSATTAAPEQVVVTPGKGGAGAPEAPVTTEATARAIRAPEQPRVALRQGTEVPATDHGGGYHGTDKVDPETAIREGFPARGDNLDLVDHAEPGPQNADKGGSAFIGTTDVIADPMGGGGGAAEWGDVVFEIRDVPTWDLHTVLDNQIKTQAGYRGLHMKGELERSVPAQVFPWQIKRYGRVVESRTGIRHVREWTDNPNFGKPERFEPTADGRWRLKEAGGGPQPREGGGGQATGAEASAARVTRPASRGQGYASSDEAHVFLGFMDEEVNVVLRQVREKYADRDVIVIERKRGMQEGQLFEKDLDWYARGEGLAEGEYAQATTTRTGGARGTEAHDELAGEINQRLSVYNLEAEAVPGKMKTLDESTKEIDPSLVVGRFAAAEASDKPPIVVVRAPELGLQPGLVGGYLQPIMESVESRIGPVRLHVFGAGGAVAESIKPGDPSAIVGSLYVGVRRAVGTRPKKPTELDTRMFRGEAGVILSKEARTELLEHQERVAYQGVLVLRGKDGSERHFHVSKPVYTDEGELYGLIKDKQLDPDALTDPEVWHNLDQAARFQAEERAKVIFREQRGKLVEVHPVTGNPVDGGETLQQAIGDLIASADDPRASVSMTTSFFGGGVDKAAGASVGIADVNMEDFWVLELAQKLRLKPNQIEVVRVNADPHEVSEDVVRRVRDWARDARLSEEAYVDAILWGRKGVPLEAMPESGHWTAFEGIEGDELRDIVIDHQGRVVNPWYTEIAVDLVNEAADKAGAFREFWDVLSQGLATALQRAEVDDDVAEAVQLSLRNHLNDHWEEIAKSANAVQDASGEALRPALREFLAKAKHLDVAPGTGLAEFLDALEESGPALLAEMGATRGPGGGWRLAILADDPSGQMRIWARPGKFAVSKVTREPAASLDQVLGQLYENEAAVQGLKDDIDRALYKSSNRQVLIEHHETFITGELEIRPESVPQVRRSARRGAAPGGFEAPAELDALMDQSAGHRLDPTTQAGVERALDADLSGVRVHTGGAAAAASGLIDAEAFAVGRDVFFDVGRYAPNSARGMALLVHELTHVAQQEPWGARSLTDGARVRDPGGGPARKARRVVGGTDDPFERQAELHEREVLAFLGGAQASAFGAAVQRRAGVASRIRRVEVRGGDQSRAELARIVQRAVVLAEERLDAVGPSEDFTIDALDLQARVDPADPDAAERLADAIVARALQEVREGRARRGSLGLVPG